MSSVELPYRYETASGHAVLVLEPGLNDVQWTDIERIGGEVLTRVKESRPSALIVDLSNMEYMGSAMVALVVRVWKAMKENGGQMAVVNRHATTLEVLRLAGLTKVWTIVTSREEAEARLRSGGGHGGSGPVSASSSRAATLGLVLGLVLLALAGGALAVNLTASPLLDAKTALGGACVLAALALIAGTATAVAGWGARRIVGVLVVVASLAVIVVGVMRLLELGALGPDVEPPAAVEAVED